jgi:protoheme IX farnesyltransferase
MSFVSPLSPTISPLTRVSVILRQRLADYAQLCRIKIAVMTMVSVAVGYTLASPIVFSTDTLLIACVGIVQLVAASSILNQCLERSTDARMVRTASRPIVSGRVTLAEAVGVSVILTLAGFSLLWNSVNALTAIATLATLLTYVLGYTVLKTRTSLCTTIGAVPGAMPPVLGWLAAGGSPGLEAVSLFALFFVWQFPHFLAIGWIHRHDYRSAGLRMLPSFQDRGLQTGLLAVIYAAAFVPVSALPTCVGMSGDLYLAAAILLSVIYLIYSVRFLCRRTEQRARSLLYNSLLCLPLLLIALVIDFLRLTAM